MKHRKEEHVLMRKVLGEALLVPVRGKLAELQRVFTLNPVAEYVWDRLDGRRTLGAIAGDVAKEFEVDAEQAAVDVGEFVARLVADGLVVKE